MTVSSDRATTQRRLRERVFSAGAWTLAAYGAELVLRLISNLILTRLLFPEAFGAIATALALIAGLGLVSDFGVQAVIIQSRLGDDVGFLRSAWTFQLWRGFLLWAALTGICVLISVPTIHDLFPTNSVFADHSLPLVTAVLGLTLVLGGAESTAITFNVRRLHFGPVVWLDLISKLFAIPAMVAFAWVEPSVWALVSGMLVANSVRLILSHTYVPGPSMRLSWRRDHFQQIVKLGRWIIVSSFATFISQQCDVILLGFVAPASTLGLYSIAKLLVTTGEGVLDRLNNALALPIFGEVVRTDPGNLRKRYYQFRLPIEATAGLLSGSLFVAGSFVVHFLYDARYSDAGLMLQILALGTVSYPFLVIINAFTASGDTHITAVASVTKAISLVGCMAIGFFFAGEIGAIAGIASHRLAPSIVIVILARRRNWIQFWYELRVIPAFVIGLFMGKALLLFASMLGIFNIHQFFGTRLPASPTRGR